VIFVFKDERGRRVKNELSINSREKKRGCWRESPGEEKGVGKGIIN